MKAERRLQARPDIEPIAISGFTSLDHLTLVARHGTLIDASASGLLILVRHQDIIPKEFRERLTLDNLVGDQVLLTIPKMDLELSGQVIRTKRVAGKCHQIAIDFSDDAPQFWRECLVELLPKPGEFD